MEENKDDYLKKKLHIKDRFIKRLETEKHQLEVDNNSIKHRLRIVEWQLSSLITSCKRKNACELEIKNQSQGSHKTCVEPHTNILPRYIPFPNANTSNGEVTAYPHESGVPAVNVGHDIKRDQLMNENLEYTLEISYLKARLKSSDAARALAERKIENLEKKLRQMETVLGREVTGIVRSTKDQVVISLDEKGNLMQKDYQNKQSSESWCTI